MTKKRTPALIGFFILGAGVLLAAGIILFGGGKIFQESAQAVIYFERSVAGLQVGAPVTFRGVNVGAVRRIALQFNPEAVTTRIPVYVEITSDALTVTGDGAREEKLDISDLVNRGLRAQLQTQSFVTGQLMVELDFRPGATPPPRAPEMVAFDTDVPEIPAVRSEFDLIKDKVTDLPLAETLASAQRVLDAVERLANTADKQINTMGENITRSSNNADQLMFTTQDAIRNLDTDLRATTAELRSLIASAKTQIDSRGSELSRVLASAEKAVTQIESTTRSVNAVIEPRGPLRRDLDSGIRDLSAAAQSLRSFAAQLERNPNALILGSDRRR